MRYNATLSRYKYLFEIDKIVKSQNFATSAMRCNHNRSHNVMIKRYFAMLSRYNAIFNALLREIIAL